MSKSSSRAALEAEIINRAKHAVPDPKTRCLDEQHLYEYLEAWHQLEQYFRDNEDTSISVEVIREYLDSLNFFFGTWKNNDTTEECREQAEEALQELEAHMRYIIEAVELKIYPYGR